MLQVDNKSKHTVFGYVRSEHGSLFKSTPYAVFQNFPISISSIVTLYYHTPEFLNVISCIKDISVSKDGKHIYRMLEWTKSPLLKICCDDNNNYGSIIIPSTNKSISRWDIKIINLPNDKMYYGLIGISSNKKPSRREQAYYPTSPSYPFYTYLFGRNRLKYHRKLLNRDYGPGIDENGKRFKNGDVISMKLDLKRRQLSYYKNHKCIGIAFDHIDIGEDINYRLSITVATKAVDLSIERFTEHF